HLPSERQPTVHRDSADDGLGVSQPVVRSEAAMSRGAAIAAGERAVKRLLPPSWIVLCALAAAPAAAQQEDVAAFFKGKTLRLVVGIGVGSGYDLNARLLARHMAGHIPGQPTIVVLIQPGAGSLILTI